MTIVYISRAPAERGSVSKLLGVTGSRLGALIFLPNRRGESMKSEGQIETLAVQHKKLEDVIATEMRHPDWDEARVAALKKQKLRIKDELERLKALH
ncbi:MAG TPA: DUF465 domain-containing protein [Rhizomicrobium sp.]|jgi:hypothetical protein